MAHDDLRRNDDAVGPTDRAVGLVFATALFVVALLPVASSRAPRVWALVVAALLAMIALLKPSFLSPLNKQWTKLGLLLHRVVSPIALGVMFFLVVTPTGWLMRLAGKDPLRLKFDPMATTYWVERNPPGPAPESLRDQF